MIKKENRKIIMSMLGWITALLAIITVIIYRYYLQSANNVIEGIVIPSISLIITLTSAISIWMVSGKFLKHMGLEDDEEEEEKIS